MNPQVIIQTQAAVAALLADFPELAEDERLRADVVEGETAFNDVLRCLAIEAKTAKGYQKGLAETIDGLESRKARLSEREKKIRNTIMLLMDVANLRKVPLPEGGLTITRKAARALPPDDVNILPDEFCRIRREPNMTAINAALAEGRHVPGVIMSNGSDVLRIG